MTPIDIPLPTALRVYRSKGEKWPRPEKGFLGTREDE